MSARLRGDTVVVEAFYSDNQPAHEAIVKVRDMAGREIAAGYTDDKGELSFPRPPAGKYEVAADAGASHRRNATITIPSETALKTLSPPRDEILVTSGPSREELTRYPWLRVAIGLATITGMAVLFWFATRNRGRPKVPHV